MDTISQARATTYLNPVYPQTFADPFVLKYRGLYWAYCTGLQPDGSAFGILRSYDLVHWQPVASAMAPLPGGHPCYWAPEVTYDNGRFFLYYSVGNEEKMHIRVAVSSGPAGPFIDSGHRLTTEPFAIDPHVFKDDDGRRYLFYATDFYDHSHVGTGIVRDRLLDPFKLAGQAQPVARPRYDWQVYDPQRKEKGGVRWHTVEGPFVLKHKGTYYQMFSGGNWQNPSYGVAYAHTDDVAAPGEWIQVADGETVSPILQSVPGHVHGPGHNSAIRGPDNRQYYCIYHRWGNGDGRLLAIDPLDWAGDRLIILGPSHTPQTAPLAPYFTDFLPDQEREALDPAWHNQGGEWIVRDGAAMPLVAYPAAETCYTLPAPAFVAEVSLAGILPAVGSVWSPPSGAWGLNLRDETKPLLKFRLLPNAKSGAGMAAVAWKSLHGPRERTFSLPDDFDFTAYHLLRLEVDGQRASLTLDESLLAWQGMLSADVAGIALCAEYVQAAFSGFAVTIGWQELFMEEGGLARSVWRGDDENWRITDGRLAFQGTGESRVARGPLLESYELIVNARLEKRRGDDACYGFLPALAAGGAGPLLTVTPYGQGWRLSSQDGATETSFSLPRNFDARVYQQFRFRKERGNLTLSWEGQDIAAGPINPAPARTGLFGRQATVAFDLVRVTAISGE